MTAHDIQINQVLGAADALISDYSSTAVDYLVRNRPMAFIVDDMGSYADRRGFIFEDMENWLPGMLLSSVTHLLLFMDEIAHAEDSFKKKRETILKKFYNIADDGNCKRIVDALGIGGK